MSPQEEEERRLIDGLRAGDPQAVRRFCEQYGPLLERLADRHLGAAVRRRVGPEDVAQSACRTFLRRARLGEFRLGDSAELWRLLCAITLTKAREQARFHQRQRRGLDREVPLGAVPAGAEGPDLRAAGPTPDEAAEFADLIEQLVADLDEEERQVLDLKLQDFTNDEVAERLGCSERTVRRVVKRLQARLAQVLETS
jgi:RNA polymerase sigma factor (sigma-70 family)